MNDIESILPIIDDTLAHKILAVWPKCQDLPAISRMLGQRINIINDRVELMTTMGLLRPDGSISPPAKSLLLGIATKNLKK